MMKTINSLLKFFKDTLLAKIILVLGLVSIIITISLGVGIGFSVAAIFGSIFYLLFNKEYNFKLKYTKIYLSNKIVSCFSILTLIYLIWSLTSFLYFRPLIYFILSGIITVFIFLEIIFSDHSVKFNKYNIIFQILLLATSLRFSPVFLYPDLIGADPYAHRYSIEFLLNQGYIYTNNDKYLHDLIFIPGLTIDQYTFRPFMQIFVAIFSIYTSINNINLSLVFTIGFFEIFSIYFLYLTTYRITKNYTVSILSMLLLSIYDWHIRWGNWFMPMSLGIAYFTIFIYLMYNLIYKADNKRNSFILAIILITSITFTHTITALIMLITIFVLWFFSYFKDFNYPIKNKYIQDTLIFSSILAVSNWYYSNFLTLMLSRFEIGNTIARATVRTPLIFELDNIGTYVIISLFIIGMLQYIKKYTYIKLNYMALSFILLAISYGGLLININFIIPERWLVFTAIIIVPIAAQGYVLFIQNKKLIALAGIITFILAFSMAISNNSNIDTPIYFPQGMGTYKSVTYSELQGIKTMSQYSNKFYGDERDLIFTNVFIWENEKTIIPIDIKTITEQIFGNNLFITRKNIYHVTISEDIYTYNLNLLFSNANVLVYSSNIR